MCLLKKFYSKFLCLPHDIEYKIVIFYIQWILAIFNFTKKQIIIIKINKLRIYDSVIFLIMQILMKLWKIRPI